MVDPSKSATRIWKPSSKLFPAQYAALTTLAGSQRNTLLRGGARAMKTFLIIYVIFVRATRSPASFHKALRLHGNAARASLWLETIPAVNRICFPHLKLVERTVDSFFEFPNEARLYVGGLDEGAMTEKILGTECVTLFLNEVSQIPYASVLTARTRLAQNVDDDQKQRLKQREYDDLNPVGKGHWSYLEYSLKQDPISRQPLPDPQNFVELKLNPRDNPNHTPEFLASLQRMPKRQRARFWDGEYQDETDDALWTLDGFDRHRVHPHNVPKLSRVVVAVDPSGAGSAEDTSRDMIGIVVVGMGVNGHCYVLADYTCHASPAEWGRKAVWAFEHHEADRIVGEMNYGGAMVEFTIKAADSSVPFRPVIASRGKHLRAEPVAALYEERAEDGVVCRVHHVESRDSDGKDHLSELEAEMCDFTTTGYAGELSPNRCDALVMAVTELGLAGKNAQGWVEHMQRMAAGGGKVDPPRPKNEKSAALVTMRAPKPFMNFAPARGVTYASDERGVIEGVAPEHVEALARSGCVEAQDA
jgi:hypothetical protein